ncbi:hypothetical protein F511_31832 [Dorcoceras hygrometricum]|uniref:Uncharacterized protein n=1 Tax=Dorcoceras hygrometricum TaxID=472368 RepID=A0A2Z7AQK6_9LAMI|nr:hypothetical protein F511_31832 [Dorcoceras hygrometricum]
MVITKYSRFAIKCPVRVPKHCSLVEFRFEIRALLALREPAWFEVWCRPVLGCLDRKEVRCRFGFSERWSVLVSDLVFQIWVFWLGAMRRRLERHVYVLIGSFDGSESGSAGLLLLRHFDLYLFRRLEIRCKKIAKEVTLCSLLPFEQIFFSVQVSDLSARDLVVVIVAQKVKVSDLSARDLVVVIVAQKVKDACIEDERQHRAPHLPAGLLLAAVSRVGSSHIS